MGTSRTSRDGPAGGRKAAGGQGSRAAFTLIELLVVIAVLSLLLTIFLPSMLSAREQAKTATCTVKLREITRALLLYASSNGDLLPVDHWFDNSSGEGRNWWTTTLLNARLLSAPTEPDGFTLPAGDSCYRCPSGVAEASVYRPMVAPASYQDPYGATGMAHYFDGYDGRPSYYIHNWYGTNGDTYYAEFPLQRGPKQNKSSRMLRAADTVAVYDGWYMHARWHERVNARHLGLQRTNFAFYDASVKTLSPVVLPANFRDANAYPLFRAY